jgi:hypothetical protein
MLKYLRRRLPPADIDTEHGFVHELQKAPRSFNGQTRKSGRSLSNVFARSKAASCAAQHPMPQNRGDL